MEVKTGYTLTRIKSVVNSCTTNSQLLWAEVYCKRLIRKCETTDLWEDLQLKSYLVKELMTREFAIEEFAAKGNISKGEKHGI